ncbi:hypothetical protein TWF281_001072 [Arthrobotrys megalospora]
MTLPHIFMWELLLIAAILTQTGQLSRCTPLSHGSGDHHTESFNTDIKEQKGSTATSTVSSATTCALSQGANATASSEGMLGGATPIHLKGNRPHKPSRNDTSHVTLQSGEPNGTSSSTNPRTGQSFPQPYYADLRIRCESPQEIMKNTPRDYATYDDGSLDLGEYPNWQRMLAQHPGNRMEVVSYIFSRAIECGECDCETGEEDFSGAWNIVANPTSEFCDTEEKAHFCGLIYDCVCEEFVAMPDIDQVRGGGGVLHRKEPNGKYIKGPPGQRYKWSQPAHNRQVKEGVTEMQEHMDGSAVFDQPVEPNWRELAPDTKEPYYLEGPTRDNERDLDYLARIGALAAGYGSFLADKATSRYPKGRKSSVWKRENSGSDNPATVTRIPKRALEIEPRP